ncbi:MAG: FecR protein [Planctomycetes bacterium ADurb.Bin126]|nr:MAG: FecR protein [Planctomycetes bacterium ADurb.Bin126]HOD84387.1 FecR domain-containing protein [Phycisphaerae bacterium]HQL76309.1 FecR domain-containing protein [Phycisphaerae bacterium]
MNETPDDLISRYLSGQAEPADVRRLDELVQTDAKVRRDLFLASALDSHMQECLGESAEAETDRPAWWRSGVLRAAAAMLLVAAGLAIFLGGYPAPTASGAYRVVGGGPVQRGSVIVAEGGPARVALGGYCRVTLDAGGSLRIAGTKRAEEVVLCEGRATCEADSNTGTFAVRSDVGAVSVTGTRFAVEMIEDQGDQDMFGRRMAVSVLTGAVLVSGTWGQMTLQAGENASTPPPEAVLRTIVAGLGLPAADEKKIEQLLSSERVKAFRSEYRTALRRDLFEVAHKTLSTTLPKAMPQKVAPKVQAIRSKLRAGPPKGGDIARIRLAVQQRARVVMMPLIHKTADDLAAKGAADDHLIASVLAKKVRAKLPEDKVAAFDAAVAAAKIPDPAPEYLAQAGQRVQDAIKAYDPDLTEIIDPKTGQLIISDAELGVQLSNPAADKRIAAKLTDILAGLNLPEAVQTKVAPLVAENKIEAQRAAAYSALREKLFAAARERLQAGMSQKMPAKVQKKVTAIRMNLKAGGPPSADELANIQKASMAKARTTMMPLLHQAADSAAADAIKDDNVTAASLAGAVRAKLTPEQVEAFNAALAKAQVAGDESAYVAQAQAKIDAAIDAYDPDLEGIVDSKTGKVLVSDVE